MRLAIACLMMMFGLKAMAGGELLGTLTYIDDAPDGISKVAPFVGAHVFGELMDKVTADLTGGIGKIDQGSGSDKDGKYISAQADVFYAFHPGWKVGVGGGYESEKSVYHAFNDYAHVTVKYILW